MFDDDRANKISQQRKVAQGAVSNSTIIFREMEETPVQTFAKCYKTQGPRREGDLLARQECSSRHSVL